MPNEVKIYEPENNFKFYDVGNDRQMMLSDLYDAGLWMLYQHVDGHWVTLRKATFEDIEALMLGSRNEGYTAGFESGRDRAATLIECSQFGGGYTPEYEKEFTEWDKTCQDFGKRIRELEED